MSGTIIVIYALLFLVGNALGSFLNVLSIRYNPDKNVFAKSSISGRSRCQNCGRGLGWFELIPLASFIAQKGRCRTCNAQLSRQYPIVEALMGVITLGTALFLNNFFD